MMRKMFLAVSIMALAASGLAAPAGQWLHVKVVESGKGKGNERVLVNVPLSLVEKILPLIDNEHLRNGKVQIDCKELGETDLRAIGEAVRETEDAEFVTVEGTDEKVRVAKSGNYLLIRAEEGGKKSEKVDIKVPLDVVDALFSGGSNELNVLEAIRALGNKVDGDLVRVSSGTSNVRVWIDGSSSGGEQSLGTGL